MKRTGTELKNKMSRQERREARLRQEKLRLQKKSKLTLIVYAVIRLIVVGVLVRSAFNGQIESVYTCLLTLVLLLLPSILERKLGVRLPAGLEITVVVFIFAAEILGEIACFYVTVPFWDKALHTTSGFIYAAVGYSMADVLNRHKKVSFELSPLFLALVAFCFSMTIGALWEIFEFSVDNLFHKDMQKDTVIQQITSVALDPTNRNIPITISNIQDVVVNGESLGLGGYLDIGLYDTMGDLIVNLIGAVLCVYDKLASSRGWKRVPERTLFFWALVGGGPGVLTVMLLIRHKTLHRVFMLGIPAVMVLQAAIVVGIHHILSVRGLL